MWGLGVGLGPVMWVELARAVVVVRGVRGVHLCWLLPSTPCQPGRWVAMHCAVALPHVSFAEDRPLGNVCYGLRGEHELLRPCAHARSCVYLGVVVKHRQVRQGALGQLPRWPGAVGLPLCGAEVPAATVSVTPRAHAESCMEGGSVRSAHHCIPTQTVTGYT